MAGANPRARRRFKRRTVRVLVDYAGPEGACFDYATTLGPGGLFIETETPLAAGTPLKVRFRLNAGGAPGGDITPWREVRFPLVVELRDRSLANLRVERLAAPGDEVEERYRCDARGVIEVELANVSASYRRRYAIHGAAP